MGYQSLKFLLFSSAVVLLYYAVGKFFKRGQQYVLLLANLVFGSFAFGAKRPTRAGGATTVVTSVIRMPMPNISCVR